jgi:NCAIR mutase (PurE)-related protein
LRERENEKHDIGNIVIATAAHESDIPVAEEAAR